MKQPSLHSVGETFIELFLRAPSAEGSKNLLLILLVVIYEICHFIGKAPVDITVCTFEVNPSLCGLTASEYYSHLIIDYQVDTKVCTFEFNPSLHGLIAFAH